MKIYMSRHGESVNNTLNIIGGDCHITDQGKKYAQFLGKYFDTTTVCVWTSKLKRTKETAANITQSPLEWADLNEIYAGDFDGMVLGDIKTYYPTRYHIRNSDKLNYGYPNGESYQDLKNRVYKVLNHLDINNNNTVLIIAHQAVCRVIYSYFTEKPLSQCVDLDIDLHTLYKLEGKTFFEVKSNL